MALAQAQEVLLIEIAQQCNVSVRDIHFAARDLGQPLQPTARGVEQSLAKTLIDHFIKSDAEAEKKSAKQKIVVEKPKPNTATVKTEQEKEPEKPKRKPKKATVIFPDEVKKLKKDKYVKIELKPKEEPKKDKKVRKFEPKVKRKTGERRPKQIPKSDTTIADELLGIDQQNPASTVDLYDRMIEEERQRQIVHEQRKKMAGKDDGRKIKKSPTISHTVKYDPNRVVEIPDVITVKEFAEKTGLGAAKIIGELMKNGILANINQQIDYETAMIIAEDLKVKLKKKQTIGSAEDIMKGNLENLLAEPDDSILDERPPIVVVMGHVDHGKTKLLDSIRQADVVSGESGGITQHIGAYQVEKNGHKITFIDTPGHEAFTKMRARGAKVTDIAILVVAADEGVKPQTVEALQHAKAAGVPILVAINKIDKPNADPDRVKGELANYDLTPEDWGGSTIMAPVSALNGQGIDDLLEMVLLVAEMENFKANFNRSAVGTVIEAHLDQSLGPVATVIVNTGTLHNMDNVVVGECYGRVKVMKDHRGKKLKEAPPSTPILIAGLSDAVQSGDILQVVPDEKTARMKSVAIKSLKEAQQRERGVGEIMSAISSGQLKHLRLVLKADTNGSLEAIKQSLSEIKNDDVGVKVLLSGVGDISESDVMMAAASGAIVMGFHVKTHVNAASVAERENVEIINYSVIYKLLDDVKNILTGMLEPEFVEKVVGELSVKMIFFSKKKEMIVGCQVDSGYISNDAKLRIYRGDEMIGETKITSLQKNQDAVKEVKEGSECGLKVAGGIKLEDGDRLEAYVIDKKIKTL